MCSSLGSPSAIDSGNDQQRPHEARPSYRPPLNSKLEILNDGNNRFVGWGCRSSNRWFTKYRWEKRMLPASNISARWCSMLGRRPRSDTKEIRTRPRYCCSTATDRNHGTKGARCLFFCGATALGAPPPMLCCLAEGPLPSLPPSGSGAK
ncbi:unnamed protein product, partial [Ectocarpus sp. 13 AM-2016]